MGTGAVWIPLLGHLHFESAFLAAWIGTFLAIGYGRKQPDSTTNDLFRLLQIQFYIYLAAVPLLIKDLLAGCFSVDGLGFWIFIPSAGILLGYAVVRLIRKIGGKKPGFWATMVIIAIAVGEFLVEFYSFPQVFFYNHVWGFWPGPIYDEALSLSGTLIFYRGITVLWALLFWFIPSYSDSVSARRLTWLSAAGLLLVYLNMGEMGIIRPPAVIQKYLGGQTSSQHFSLYYDREHIPQQEAEYFKMRHEFYFRSVADTLQISTKREDGRIESFIYSHPWQKKKLVGAKYTSYVPVWLDQDQLHIAYPQLSSSLHHELVHVASKSFGNQLLNASWSIGMVEGLAVAVARNVTPYSTVDQLVAAKTPYPDAERLREALSFTGFYGGRKTVNYVTTGSFISYLIRNYKVDYLKKAYRNAELEDAYPVPFDSLVAGWHRYLQEVSTDSLDRARRTALFSIPSLFERRCPHTRTEAERTWDRYRYWMAEGDTARADQVIQQSCDPSCPDLRVWSRWAYDEIARKNHQPVITHRSWSDSLTKDAYFPAALRLADAYFMSGRIRQARKFLRRSVFPENGIGSLYHKRSRSLRGDSSQWTQTIRIIYRQQMPDPGKFAQIPGALKAIIMDRLMKKRPWREMAGYANEINSSDINVLNFKTFVRVARRLFFIGNMTTGDHLLSLLQKNATRLRQQQMMRELREWKQFLASLNTRPFQSSRTK